MSVNDNIKREPFYDDGNDTWIYGTNAGNNNTDITTKQTKETIDKIIQ